jgi:hypothetical protein
MHLIKLQDLCIDPEILFCILLSRKGLRACTERTKAGLARVKAQGKKLGRPIGAKDKDFRQLSGYISRWLKKA